MESQQISQRFLLVGRRSVLGSERKQGTLGDLMMSSVKALRAHYPGQKPSASSFRSARASQVHVEKFTER